MKLKQLLDIGIHIASVILIYSGILITLDNTVIKLLTKYPENNNLIGAIIFFIGVGLFMFGYYVIVVKDRVKEPTKDFKERHQKIIKSDKECNNCALYQRESIKQDMIQENKPEEEIKETLKYLDGVIDMKYGGKK